MHQELNDRIGGEPTMNCLTFRCPTAWKTMQKRAMAQDVGWQVSAGHYMALYKRLCGA